MGNWVSVPHSLSVVSLDLIWGSEGVIGAHAELFQRFSAQLVHLGRAITLFFARKGAAVVHLWACAKPENNKLNCDLWYFYPMLEQSPSLWGAHFGSLTCKEGWVHCFQKLWCSVKKLKYCVPCCWKLLSSMLEMTEVVWTKDGGTSKSIKDRNIAISTSFYCVATY